MKEMILFTILYIPSLAIFAENNIFANAFGLIYAVAITCLMRRKAWGRRILRKMYKISLLIGR